MTPTPHAHVTGTAVSRGSQSVLRAGPGTEPAPEPPGAAAVTSPCPDVVSRGPGMAEQRGVILSLCPHEMQSLGMRIHAYKSPGLATCCAAFPSLCCRCPVRLRQMEEVPEEVAVCLPDARTECKAMAAGLSHVSAGLSPA